MTDDERGDAERAIEAARDSLGTARAINAETVQMMRGLRNDIAEVMAEIIAVLEVDESDLALEMLRKFHSGLVIHSAARQLH